MSRNGSGTYSLPGATNPVVSGTSISSTWANATLSDVGSELTNSVAIDGQSVMTGQLKLKDGTNGSPAWTFGSESTTGFYRKSAGVIGISVAGVEKYTISATALTLPADPSSAMHATTKQYVDAALISFRNKLINGNFDFWQRGTSLSAATGARYLADRFGTTGVGSTAAPSQQAFALGQTSVPGEPAYFHRTVVASSAGAGNYALQYQRVESVRTLAGQTATLTFWAKADASKNIAVEFWQDFGTGGSPSAAVTGIGVTTCALTTSWQKFTVAVSPTSISGKALGSNADDTLSMFLWFDAGSTYNSRTNSLGQQSGTFDIAQVQLEVGATATQFERRQPQVELALCQRYYEKSYNLAVVPGTVDSTGNAGAYADSLSSAVHVAMFNLQFAVQKRATPAITFYSPATGAAGKYRESAGDINPSSNNIGASGGRHWTTTSVCTVFDVQVHWTANAEL